ncbi:probable inactive leucine-rich repeat receptor-like protein kinase At3g03770 [Telopea speciosissima]|uniref:probable inactive leucine-rich repeat receptor-like protein kinase At3g03770 n=1 Tax=Telopea speciosissima TaxID=54955 RepID=UPI001CC79D40|nr:probable inactive leucine-rich repeat receptor-like protein kinase At3g03770 [Telopea speciosissima]
MDQKRKAHQEKEDLDPESTMDGYQCCSGVKGQQSKEDGQQPREAGQQLREAGQRAREAAKQTVGISKIDGSLGQAHSRNLLFTFVSTANNSITELKVMGDKPTKVSKFDRFVIPNQTLSEVFSIDSFVPTVSRLTNLRVLSLVSMGIWGPLPYKIHRLYSLEHLDLSSNFLFGSIPPQISTMERLQTVTLDGNFFNDTVPDWLDSLSNLTFLSLKRNKLKGTFPSSICRIKTLAVLALSQNKISGKLPEMDCLTNLHVLDLGENQLDSELPILPKRLVTVLLSKNSFSGEIPQQYDELVQLQHLDLSFNSDKKAFKNHNL